MRSRLADPPAIVAVVLLAGLAVGVAVVSGLSLLVAIGIAVVVGGLVYGIAVTPGLVADRRRLAGWGRAWRPMLRRADRAVAQLRRHQRATADPELARLLSEAGTRAAAVSERLRERVRAAAAVQAMDPVANLEPLRRERARLDREAAAQPAGRLRSEKEAAATAAGERIAAQERLVEMRDLLLAGIETATLQLEAVAARGAVLLSLGLTAGGADTGSSELDALAAELASVQETLEQTEEITRQLLGQSPG